MNTTAGKTDPPPQRIILYIQAASCFFLIFFIMWYIHGVQEKKKESAANTLWANHQLNWPDRCGSCRVKIAGPQFGPRCFYSLIGNM
jgi:hypothetical protein